MHRGCFGWMPTPPPAGRRTPRPGPARVCVCSSSWPGRAYRPQGRIVVRLTFSFGRFVFWLCSAPSGLGMPLSCSFFCLLSSLRRFLFFFFVPFACPRCPLLSLVSGPGCLLPWRCVSLSPTSPLVLLFFSDVRPRCLLLSFLSGPGCPGPWCCVVPAPSPPSWYFCLFFFCPGVFLLLPSFSASPPPFFFLACCVPPPSSCLFCWSPAVRLSVCSRCFCASRLAVGWSLVVAAPPPFCVSRFLSLPLGAPFFLFFLGCFATASLLGARRRFSPFAPPPPRCARGAFCCLVLPRPAALPSGVLRCRVAVFRAVCRAVVPHLAVLWAAARYAVFVGALLCVLCCVVGCWCVLCRVSGSAVRLGCSRCDLLSGFGLRCDVLCCALCP